MPAPARAPLRLLLAGLGLLLATGGCVAPAAAPPAVLRSGPPPWAAPVDAVSYIREAGLEPQPLGLTQDPHLVTLTIRVAGRPVVVPAHLGVDRKRAVQAVVHTHDESGEVWLEGRGGDTVTLGQLFAVWGVRFGGGCLGDVCSGLVVRADGATVAGDPSALRLRQARTVDVRAG